MAEPGTCIITADADIGYNVAYWDQEGERKLIGGFANYGEADQWVTLYQGVMHAYREYLRVHAYAEKMHGMKLPGPTPFEAFAVEYWQACLEGRNVPTPESGRIHIEVIGHD